MRSPSLFTKDMAGAVNGESRFVNTYTLQCLSILCTSGESVFHSANNLTWTEAQAFCRSNQSTLIPGTKAGFPYPHWTGLYHRLSDWIHVLGNQTETKIKSLTPFGTKFFDKLRAALETFILSRLNRSSFG